MLLYFKVNEHLKDIMEQTQKLKDHHTVEASGGQKVHVLKKKRRLCETLCSYVCAVWGSVKSVFIKLVFGDLNCTVESLSINTK